MKIIVLITMGRYIDVVYINDEYDTFFFFSKDLDYRLSTPKMYRHIAIYFDVEYRTFTMHPIFIYLGGYVDHLFKYDVVSSVRDEYVDLFVILFVAP